MAITVSDDFTTLYSFDSSTDESADGSVFGGTGQTNTTLKVQGTASCMYQAKGTGVGSAGKFNSSNNFNLSSTHIHAWMRSLDNFNTEANAGMRLRVANSDLSANNNYGEWTLGGQDTRRAVIEGFFPLVVDTARTFDFTAGTAPGLSSIDAIGMGGNMTSQSGQNTFFVDEIKEGSKTNISGGTVPSPGTSSQLSDDDFTNGRGTFRFTLGIYAILSGLDFGDTAAASSYFIEGGETWVCENMPVSNSYYTINIVGNATGTNHFIVGTENGSGTTSSGIGGNSIRANDQPFIINATDSNADAAHFFGWTFDNASSAEGRMNLEHANAKVVSSLIRNNGQINIRNGAHLRKNTIVNSVHGAGEAAVNLGDTDPTANTFRENSIENASAYGILLDGSVATGATWNFRDIKFSNNTTADVLVDYPAQTGGNKVTINVLEGGDTPTIAVTGGIVIGDVVVNNTVTLTVQVNDPAAVAVQGARVRIEQTSDGALVAEGTTNASGTFTNSTFNYTVDLPVVVKVRLKGFKSFRTNGTITANGLSVGVRFEPNTIVDLP